MRFQQALREAFWLGIAAVFLGFVYTASTEKGVFSRSFTERKNDTPGTVNSPVMVSLDQAKTLFDAGDALFIDARHEFDYKLGHIRSAINIPLNSLDTRQDVLSTISKERLIIVYCDGAECNSSIELSAKLSAFGFSNVKIFFGGWREWEAAKFPLERQPQ